MIIGNPDVLALESTITRAYHRPGPGYYREFTVQPAPGVSGRGAERLVVGQGGEVFYTPNHYGSFVRIQ